MQRGCFVRAIGLRPSKWASAYEEGYGIFLFPSGECAVPSASSAAKGYGRRRPLSSFHRRLKPLAEASALAGGTERPNGDLPADILCLMAQALMGPPPGASNIILENGFSP